MNAHVIDVLDKIVFPLLKPRDLFSNAVLKTALDLHAHVSVISNIEHILDDGIAETLMKFLNGVPNDATISQAILYSLLRVKNAAGLKYSLEQIERFLVSGDNREHVLLVARILIELAPRESWEKIWLLLKKDADLGKKLIESATGDGFGNLKFISLLNERELYDFFIWMVQNYPFHFEQLTKPGPVSTVFTAQRLRDALLQQLVSVGTPEALRLLRSLRKRLSALPWDYYIDRAEESFRLASWAIPNAKELLKLADVAEKRLVNNADQLLDVIEEALERIQKNLHAETGSVIELWNYSRGQKREYWPKDENDFSNWLKRQLELEIKTKDIIIAREVEIRRKVRAGERTDIYVAVRRRTDSHRDAGNS
jgi:hypothetical protein